jgi:hypothetical protein
VAEIKNNRSSDKTQNSEVVSQASRRLELKAGEDQQLKMMISRLKVVLGGARC